jgi:hypothetical protein
MKPLPENHFTPEDWDVIIDVVLRCGRIVDGSMFGYWVMERSRQSDRRDAGFMLLLARTRGVWMSVQDWYGMLEEAGLAGYGEFTVQALRPPLNAISHKG